MKKFMTLLLAAGLVFSAASSASAIDFKAQGQWLVGFAGGQGNFVDKTRTTADGKKKADSSDRFSAAQRIRLQLDAVASEALSGTVYFEIGDQTWGSGGTYGKGSGGAMGADGVAVEVKRAYIDWAVPETTLAFRMGIQGLTLPNAAGGSAVLDDDGAAVTFHMQFNENVGLTGMWARPLNDNYDVQDGDYSGNNKKSYLDNIDLFALTLPLTFDGIEVTPWAMLGVIGQNAFRSGADNATTDVTPYMTSNYMDSRWNHGDGDGSFERTKNANTTAFWAGLPVKLTLWDPLNIEFDINYGYVGSQGRGTIARVDGGGKTRFSTERQGWLAKALVEYKMDWGTPGIFGWYASGDDDNPKNGSERMPSVSPSTNFTSFMGDGNLAWSSGGSLYDRNLSLAGTWGIGLQVADMSFVEDLKHTFRIAYWGGTNSPSMAKYAAHPWSWESGNGGSYDDSFSADPELYLTTNDGLLEFNLVNSYQMYENFEINFELGYIVNFIDHDTWKKANRTEGYDAQDAWKAQLIFAYTF